MCVLFCLASILFQNTVRSQPVTRNRRTKPDGAQTSKCITAQISFYKIPSSRDRERRNKLLKSFFLWWGHGGGVVRSVNSSSASFPTHPQSLFYLEKLPGRGTQWPACCSYSLRLPTAALRAVCTCVCVCAHVGSREAFFSHMWGFGTLQCFWQRKSGISKHQFCIILNTSISSEISLDFRSCTLGKQSASTRNLPA